MRRDDIAFLHTAPVHVATFDALLRAMAPGLQAHHAVDESLLADAQRWGVDDPGLVLRVHAAMRAAATGGAGQVVCTCSTLGALAEGMPADDGFQPARIDRAMADRAVQQGPRVLLAFALASTQRPTQALLADSAARLRRPLAVTPLQVDGAWACFEQGDRAGYLDRIARAVRAHADGVDVVVLAQASMAGAAEHLLDLRKRGLDVLSSPAPGVAAVVERWRASLA